MHASYQTIEDRPALRFERHLAHPVDSVWRAITESEELGHWFPCKVDLDLRPGGAMRFTFPEASLPDGSSTLRGEITELEPPRLFAFNWGEDHLRFELEPTNGDTGCILRFTVLLDQRDKAARDAAGWHVCLDGLERRLAGASDATIAGATDEWRAHYEEYGRRGMPTGALLPGDPGWGEA
jgi:uncharacterized protein YndB with AHSA1/START domain